MPSLFEKIGQWWDSQTKGSVNQVPRNFPYQSNWQRGRRIPLKYTRALPAPTSLDRSLVPTSRKTASMRRRSSRYQRRPVRRTRRSKASRSSRTKRKRGSTKRSKRRTSSRRSTKGGAKRFVENVVNNMHSTHTFSRSSVVTAASTINHKAFLVLAPANDVTTVETYISSLVTTDSYVEKTSRASVKQFWKTYEFHANGNPGYVRVYWLTPRNNPASGTAGAISSGASSISSLITADDTAYAPGGSLATNLENTLFDSPSVVRDYKIIKVTKWKKLSPVNNQTFRIKQTAHYPRILDAGADILSTKWRYLPKTVIPVVELKGYGGMDASYVINPSVAVPANSGTSSYTLREDGTVLAQLGAFAKDSGGVTHWNVSAFTLMVRIQNGCDLQLLSDEVREIRVTDDTAPTNSVPIYVAPRLEAYLATS